MVGHSPPLYVHNHAQTWSSRKHWRLFCCCNQTKCWGRSNHEPRKPWKLIVQWLHLLFSCWWKAVAFLWPLLGLERGPYLTTDGAPCVPDFPQRKSIFRNHHCDMLFILQTNIQSMVLLRSETLQEPPIYHSESVIQCPQFTFLKCIW